MEFLMSAMRNTSVLCGAIVVSAVIAILADMTSPRITVRLWDGFDLLLVLLVAIYLRVSEHHEFRRLIRGMLYAVTMLLVVMYLVGAG